MSETTFTVTVTLGDSSGCSVRVSDPSGEQFATTTAHDMWTALEMSLPYMAATAEPDPLAALMRAYSELRSARVGLNR